MGVIPIVNENDTVSTDEIEIGDNDTLSAVVAAITGADLLILLSDIDGLYTDDPSQNKDALFIECISGIVQALFSDNSMFRHKNLGSHMAVFIKKLLINHHQHSLSH